MDMETVFDHGITADEIKSLGIQPAQQAEYVSRMKDADTVNADIAQLFASRGDDRTADKYFNRIKNPTNRFNAQLVDEGVTS